MTGSFKPIAAAIVKTLVFILNAVLLRDLRKNSHQISDKKIRITAQLCLLSSATMALLFVIFNTIEYISLTPLNTNPFSLKSISNIVLFFRVFNGVSNFIFVGYFITIKLEHAFKDTFLSVNRRIIYVFFAFYVSTMFINYCVMLYLVFIFSHWYPMLAQEPFPTLFDITNTVYTFISEIYFILILVIFNWKLFKFVRLTAKNNQVLSLEINNRFKNFVIKQTNLISIIIIGFCIFQAIAYLKWVKLPQNNLVNLLYPILYTVQQSLWAICVYLTFRFNNKHYRHWCKYLHFCCDYSCTKCTKLGSHQQKDSWYQLPSISQLTVNDRTPQSVEEDVITFSCVAQNCDYFQIILDALIWYNHRKGKLEYVTNDILNAFNHLLEEHDSPEEFEMIYSKLTAKMRGNVCEYSTCPIYSRHYSRRTRDAKNTRDTRKRTRVCDDEKESAEVVYNDEEIKYCLQDILDKLHSFYYHSYDTFVRIKVTEHRFNDQDDRLSSIHRMVKSRRERLDRPEAMTNNNKFNSNLKLLEDNKIENDIYSFGERFEYDDEENEMSVTPKYSSIKAEFIDNDICSIDVEVYQIEYDKCTKYLEADICKERRYPMDSILALLIYCNCDKYQRKWSETFRQIPYNESRESLINRHSHFYHCSKNLRDLIEYYGSALIEKDNENKTFYHGVNQVLYLTRTITKFNAPLSTSTEAAVALNFSGNVGVVLQLKYSSSTYLLHAKYFDCAFFSDYVNEKECLFLGGIPMMIITNIINVSNGTIYRKYINALNIINCILNGTLETDNHHNYDFNESSVELCADLISYQLSKSDDVKADDANNKFPEYIVESLNRYCMKLSNITIFWNHTENFSELKSVLCNDVNNGIFFDMRILLTLFSNLQQIEYVFVENKELRSTVNQLIDHVGGLSDVNNLKYVIIHHKTAISKYDNNGWKSFQDDSKIILHRELDETNFDDLNFKYDQIKQSIASKSMIRNLL